MSFGLTVICEDSTLSTIGVVGLGEDMCTGVVVQRGSLVALYGRAFVPDVRHKIISVFCFLWQSSGDRSGTELSKNIRRVVLHTL